MNLFEIRDLAIKSGRSVFSVQQLANLLGKPKAIATVYFSRLVKKNLAARILRGKIAFSEDDFVIATQLVEPSYVTAQSALLFHGLLQQIPGSIECATTKNTRKISKFKINYHKIPPSLFFGFEKIGRENSYFFIAGKEKALIDGIYLNILPKNVIGEIKEKLDIEKLKEHIEKFKGKGRKKLERLLL